MFADSRTTAIPVGTGSPRSQRDWSKFSRESCEEALMAIETGAALLKGRVGQAPLCHAGVRQQVHCSSLREGERSS